MFLAATLALFLTGCETIKTQSSLTCTPEIRKMSYADDALFRQVLKGINGVGFADEVIFPQVKERLVTKIEVDVPYDNQKTGVEHWTVQHDGKDSCSYLVKFTPVGNGSTNYRVQPESGSPQR